MISKELSKFRRGNFTVTSITLTKEQYKFIKDNDLNFSKVVQAAIDKLMSQNNTPDVEMVESVNVV